MTNTAKRQINKTKTLKLVADVEVIRGLLTNLLNHGFDMFCVGTDKDGLPTPEALSVATKNIRKDLAKILTNELKREVNEETLMNFSMNVSSSQGYFEVFLKEELKDISNAYRIIFYSNHGSATFFMKAFTALGSVDAVVKKYGMIV